MKLKNVLTASSLVCVLILSVCESGGSIGMLSPTHAPVPALAPALTLTDTERPIGDYKSAVAAEINAIRFRPQSCGGVAYPAAGALG